MSRSKPLQGAAGWRVTERRERSWRAGYVIVPVALAVGCLQILIPSVSERWGWPYEQRQSAPAGATGSAERQPQTAPEAETEEPLLPGSRVRTSVAEPGEEPALGAPEPARVFIHHTAGTANALPAIQLAAYLQARGFDVTGIRSVDFTIEQPSVRYFFEGDQPEGRRLVEAIGSFFAKAPGQAPDKAADFSHFAPKPHSGNIEVWLPESRADGTS